MIASGAGLSAFRLAFELSPIILVGGAADLIPFKMLPIMAITEAINMPLGILGGGDMSFDNAFAHYAPLPGASMIDQEIAQYPFANQTVAANSIMTKPLMVSFTMTVPARGNGGYFAKMPMMMMIQKVFEIHNKNGGTYTLLTPSFIYTNCLMVSMRDTSTTATHQVQNTWQLDFVKPLLTLNDAQNAEGAMNGMMERLTNGSQMIGDPLTSGMQQGLGSGLPGGELTGGVGVPTTGTPPLSPAGVGSPFGEAPIYTQASGPPLSVSGIGAPF